MGYQNGQLQPSYPSVYSNGNKTDRREDIIASRLCTEGLLKDTALNNISLLALPEHCICLPWNANCPNVEAIWGVFSLLKFHIIGHDNVCKESLDLIHSKKATRAD